MAALLAPAYEAFGRLVEGLDERDLLRPTRCAGWAVVDVVTHVISDAQRALMAAATPTQQPATADAVSYWTAWAADNDPAGQARSARFTRIQASAYRGPEGLLAHWRDTAGAAVRAVAARSPDERVATQGHVLSVADLERTLAVEAAVHHLDCLLDLPARPGPPAPALRAARDTLERLAGASFPGDDDEAWVLRGAGRTPLRAQDREALGAAADRFPLLG